MAWRSVVIHPAHAQKIVGGEVFTSTIALNGQVAGVWKRVVRKSEVLLEMTLFAPLKKAERQAVTLAAERYGAFLGLPVTLTEAKA